MSDHTLTIEFDDGVYTTLACHAPGDAECHVVWDCDCEEFYSFSVEDGVPIHYPAYDTPTTTVDDGLACRGHFDPDACNLRDWHSNSDDGDVLTGTLTVPVTGSWGHECYVFDVTPKEAEAAPDLDAAQHARAEAVRGAARYLDRIHPAGLTPKRAVLADLEVVADRLGRGLHASGRERAGGAS
jgi:hypothetical protein